MKPAKPKPGGKDGKLRWILLIVGVLLISVVVWFLLSPSGENLPRFSKFELSNKKISPDESTTLKLQIENPSENDYENVMILITTESDYVTLSYGQEKNKSVTLYPEKPLRHGEESKLYVCDVRGTLPSGAVSLKVVIRARLRADEEITDEESVFLTIKQT